MLPGHIVLMDSTLSFYSRKTILLQSTERRQDFSSITPLYPMDLQAISQGTESLKMLKTLFFVQSWWEVLEGLFLSKSPLSGTSDFFFNFLPFSYLNESDRLINWAFVAFWKFTFKISFCTWLTTSTRFTLYLSASQYIFLLFRL